MGRATQEAALRVCRDASVCTLVGPAEPAAVVGSGWTGGSDGAPCLTGERPDLAGDVGEAAEPMCARARSRTQAAWV